MNNQSEPTCGICGKVMTPENAAISPELFLCDDCTLTPRDKQLAEEAKASMHPYHCVLCGQQLRELPLGFLGCPACLTQYVPTSDRAETEFSLTWVTFAKDDLNGKRDQ